MIEHQDDIKKAEFFGREEGFYYISNIFTMPKPSKNEKAEKMYYEQLKNNDTDAEMDLLENVYQQVRSGGWIEE